MLPKIEGGYCVCPCATRLHRPWQHLFYSRQGTQVLHLGITLTPSLLPPAFNMHTITTLTNAPMLLYASKILTATTISCMLVYSYPFFVATSPPCLDQNSTQTNMPQNSTTKVTAAHCHKCIMLGPTATLLTFLIICPFYGVSIQLTGHGHPALSCHRNIRGSSMPSTCCNRRRTLTADGC